MATTPQERTTLRRSLSVWQAVGISVALMAPSMAGLPPRMSAAFRHLDESPDAPADAPSTS